MARTKNDAKRTAILVEGKTLFARHGFDGVSVSDLVRNIGLPVGTVYTYFKNKDDIIRTIIEEGWKEFYDQLVSACALESSASRRIDLIVDRFLPQLFKDTELIGLFLTDGVRFTDLNAKLESLASFIGAIIADLARERNAPVSLPGNLAMVALTVYFLGCMDTVRLAAHTGLAFSETDVLAFVRLSINNAFGMTPSAPPPID